MLERTFTVAQANALLPWLIEIFGETRAHVDELHALRQRAHEQDDSDHAERIHELEREIRARLEEAASLGVEIRSVDGLVDFPSWIDGQMGFLCWRYGEEQVSHWHPTSEGFNGRRPLEPTAAQEIEIN